MRAACARPARTALLSLELAAEEARVKTIFVLDDDPDQAELMAQALPARGRRVRAFSDPIRALAALTSEGADLLIADLSMPWIDGKDVVASAHLRRPELRGLPGLAAIRAAPRSPRSEGVPFFAKPVDLDGAARGRRAARSRRAAARARPAVTLLHAPSTAVHGAAHAHVA